MTSRPYDIMDELPAIFATVTGLTAADVEIGYRDPAGMEEDELPRVLVYNPTTAEPDAAVFGLRSVEFAFAVLVVNSIDTDETTDRDTMRICEDMAIALGAATLTNADTARMNPGSTLDAEDDRQAIVGAFIVANWEGL